MLTFEIYLKNCSQKKVYHLGGYLPCVETDNRAKEIRAALNDVCETHKDLWDFKGFSGGGIAGIYQGLIEFREDCERLNINDLEIDFPEVFASLKNMKK